MASKKTTAKAATRTVRETRAAYAVRPARKPAAKRAARHADARRTVYDREPTAAERKFVAQVLKLYRPTFVELAKH